MPANRKHTLLAHLALIVGAGAVLATGADHLDEYTANGFSTVPTIGTLFLLNFIAATLVGTGLLLPWKRLAKRFGPALQALLAVGGIGIGVTSLIALWISESSSLFGFTDHGLRPTIVVAIVAESIAVIALSVFLALDRSTAGRGMRSRMVRTGRPSTSAIRP